MTDSGSPLDSLAGALVETNDQLLALYQLATITTQSLDEVEATSEILRRAMDLLDADEVVLRLGDQELEARESGQPSVGWRSRTPRRRSEDLAGSSNKATTSTAIDVSVGALHGVLIAVRRERPFGTADLKLLSAVATMALGAVQTSRHHHDALSRAVMARDHDTAAELAQLALPRWRPSLPGLELFARSDSARSAGGDLFTFAVVGDTLRFVVGDVSGKGLPAAMMMTTVISAATAAFQTEGKRGPSAVLHSIDRWVHDYLSEAGLFVTLLAGSFCTSTRELLLANAGHAPVLFVPAGDGSQRARTIDASVPPVGVLPLCALGTDALVEEKIEASPGARLVVASDGFTEQPNQVGTMWGEDRLATAVTTDAVAAARELGERLFHDLEHFSNGAEQSDDRTLLILGVVG